MQSTSDVLTMLTRDFLSGEGSLQRTLRQCGYVPGYRQTALDEYRFFVGNLATDLKDGIILT